MYTPLSILYQDQYIVAINKPAGLLVHKTALARGERRFAMQLLRDQLGQHVFPLHRLDRPTSGVLLFALSSDYARTMSAYFAEQKVEKTYLALLRGYLNNDGELDYPLKEQLDKIADKQADTDKEAQSAITQYKSLQQVELPYAFGRYQSVRYTLVQLKPKTGRKHQLRRHMAHLRHPIIGDTTHGDNKQNRFFERKFQHSRLWLHAESLSLFHPWLEKQINIQAPISDQWHEMQNCLGLMTQP